MTNPTPQTTQATTQAQGIASLLQTSQQEERRLNEILGLRFPPDLSEEEAKVWNSFFILMRFMYSEEMMDPKDPLESYIPYLNSLDLEGKREYLTRLTSMAWEKQKDNETINRLYNYDRQASDVQEVLAALPPNRWLEFIDKLFNGNPPQELVNNLQEFISQGSPQAPDIEFTHEEIEVLQQTYLEKVLNQTRRKPLNAGRLNGPGYNQTFSADDISNLINQGNSSPQESLPTQKIQANSQPLPPSPTPVTQVRTAQINGNPRPLPPNQNQPNFNRTQSQNVPTGQMVQQNQNQPGYPPVGRSAQPPQNQPFPQNRPRPPLPVQRPTNPRMTSNPLPHKTSGPTYSPTIKGLDSLLNKPPQK